MRGTCHLPTASPKAGIGKHRGSTRPATISALAAADPGSSTYVDGSWNRRRWHRSTRRSWSRTSRRAMQRRAACRSDHSALRIRRILHSHDECRVGRRVDAVQRRGRLDHDRRSSSERATPPARTAGSLYGRCRAIRRALAATTAEPLLMLNVSVEAVTSAGRFRSGWARLRATTMSPEVVEPTLKFRQRLLPTPGAVQQRRPRWYSKKSGANLETSVSLHATPSQMRAQDISENTAHFCVASY